MSSSSSSSASSGANVDASSKSKRQAAGAKVKKSSWIVSTFFEPHPDVNYGTMAVIYLVLSLVSVALLALSKFGQVKAVEGFYLIPSPAMPMLLWALWLRSQSKTAKAVGGATQSEDKKSQ
jgi:hypothetical protein